MTYLFSYGTLQNSKIQKELFHRQLTGSVDSLLGFELSKKKAYGKYPAISKVADLSSSVIGTVYEISTEELEQVDNYEGLEYTRILVKLLSGKKAWVYVAK